MDGKGTASLTQGLRSTLCIFVHGKVSKDTEMSIDFIGTSVLQDIQVIHIFAWKLKRKKDRKKERKTARERERARAKPNQEHIKEDACNNSICEQISQF